MIVSLTSQGMDGLMFPFDDDVCAAGFNTRFDAIFEGSGNAQPPQNLIVELEDADGTALATETLATAGGTAANGACSWTVEFRDVPIDDTYRATVRGAKGEVSGIGKGPRFSLDVSNPR